MDTQFGSFSASFAFTSVQLSGSGAASLSALLAAAGSGAGFSGLERQVLQGLGAQLAGGRELDAHSAEALSGAVAGFSGSGLAAFPQAAPFTAGNLQHYAGSQLFAGLTGYLAGAIAQKLENQLFLDTADNLLDMAAPSPQATVLREALGNADLSAMSAADRSSFLASLAFAVASGGPSLAQAQALLGQLAATQGSGWAWASALSSGPAFSYQVTGPGTASIDLGDGYTLQIDQANSEFVLVDNNTGHTTTVWGDPHMGVDGNTSQFQFKQDITLNLPDGTKITVQTTPWDAGNGAYVTQNLVITRGDQALVVKDMDQNKADLGNMSIQQYSGPGAGQLERLLNPDGTELYLNAAGDGWDLLQGGLFLRPLTEQDLVNGDAAQANGSAGAAWSFGLLIGLLSQSSAQDGPDNAVRLAAALR